MKRNIIIGLFALFALCGCRDNSGLYVLLNDYDYRIAALEQLCAQMNTNIAALQTLVNAQQSGDYITAVTPIMSGNNEIGYTITFGNHESITIYNGKNGVDGQNGRDGKDGTDGQDGHTPIIGIAQDENGVYYWTLDGEPIVDANGTNLYVAYQNGKDGQDGRDGKDGQNGQDGKDGVDGVTPQLKIEADYWWISYDNGTTWTQLGKATGEKGDKGDNGDQGATGEKGDSMFQSVTEDENYVYFTLANGDVLTIRKFKNDEVQIIDGAIMAEFSVSDTKKVYFSMGGLQFSENGTHQCADGTTKAGIWRFAPNQWAQLWDDNWQSRFTWGSSGIGTYIPPSSDITMTDTYSNLDWGIYNAISNGGNTPGMWRTLSPLEWSYLFERGGESMWLFAQVYLDISNYINCIIIFPDNYAPISVDHSERHLESLPSTPIFRSTWEEWKKHGVVALPGVDYVTWTNKSYYAVYRNTRYRHYDNPTMNFYYEHMEGTKITNVDYLDASYTLPVRLVKDVE